MKTLSARFGYPETCVMIDCGHNATTRWKPGNALRRHNITYLDGLCVTNYDEDHALAVTRGDERARAVLNVKDF